MCVCAYILLHISLSSILQCTSALNHLLFVVAVNKENALGHTQQLTKIITDEYVFALQHTRTYIQMHISHPPPHAAAQLANADRNLQSPHALTNLSK